MAHSAQVTTSFSEKGEMAQMSNIVGAEALADLVKTTLGPKGMDKILISASGKANVEVTNDGATILKSIHVDNPAARVLIEIAKTQDDEVGDGTTSVVVLAGELLREADKLLQLKIHPQTIIEGFRLGADVARKALEASAKDNRKNEEQFKKDLLNIARTTLSSKVLQQEKDHFAKIAVDAVLRLKNNLNLDNIQILKKPGGSLKDSFLDEGFILDKQIGVGQPKRVENAKILVANTAMDTDKIKIHGARVKTSSMTKLAEIEQAEKDKMKAKCEKILAHKPSVFINRQLIYDYPQEFFADHNVMAIEHADFEGVERLALVLGAEIVSTFDNPSDVKLGQCKLIEEVMIGESRLIKFSGCTQNEACTIVLRGSSSHLLDEADRSLHDALCVLQQTVIESRTVYGGGCSEMLMAKAVQDEAKKTSGKKALAMEAFARALKQLPATIADNAGLDSADLISNLEAEHYKNNVTAGIDIEQGQVGDVSKLGITEAFKVKIQVLLSASEAAEMILRVDDVVRCMPRKRTPNHPHM